MILTDRDNLTLEIIEKFRVADRSHIERLVYNDIKFKTNYAVRRLQLLYKNKFLKRTRSHIDQKFVYYTKVCKQIRHKLLLLELFTQLKSMANISLFEPEYAIDNLIADGFMAIKIGEPNIHKIFFIEVHISHNNLDLDKYTTLFKSNVMQRKYGDFPTLIVISDQNVTMAETPYKKILIDSKFKNIKDVLTC